MTTAVSSKRSLHQVAHQGGSKQDWGTPPGLFQVLNEEFRFTLDAAASPENALCPAYFTAEQDALQQDWGHARVFVNPPYSDIMPWVMKARDAARAGATVVMLLPASTSTRWFHDVVKPHAEVRFLRGKVRFVGAENVAPFASIVVVFRSWGRGGESAVAGGAG